MVVPEPFAAGVLDQLRIQLNDIDLRELFIHPLYSDVVIHHRDKEFHLHKLILSARSPYFARLLQTSQGQKCQCIIIKSTVETRTLGEVLNYIYSLEIPHWYGMGDLRDLCWVARSFELKNLSDFCSKNMWYVNELRFIKLSILAEENNSECREKSLHDLFESLWPSINTLSYWQEFSGRYPDFASELMRVISENK